MRKIKIEMLVERNQLSELFHLQQFAFDHLLRQFDQRVENAEVSLLHRHFESLHVEPVAGQHAFRVAPLRVRGGAAAARLGFVNNVVMHQRGRMNNLDDRAQPHRSPALVIEKFGGEEKKRRADALAATVRRYSPISVMACTPETVSCAKLAFERGEIVVQQVEDFFPVNVAGALNMRFPVLLSPRRHGVTEENLKQKSNSRATPIVPPSLCSPCLCASVVDLNSCGNS